MLSYHSHMEDRSREAVTEAVTRNSEANQHLYDVLRQVMRDEGHGIKTELSALMTELGHPMKRQYLRLVERRLAPKRNQQVANGI